MTKSQLEAEIFFFVGAFARIFLSLLGDFSSARRVNAAQSPMPIKFVIEARRKNCVIFFRAALKKTFAAGAVRSTARQTQTARSVVHVVDARRHGKFFVKVAFGLQGKISAVGVKNRRRARQVIIVVANDSAACDNFPNADGNCDLPAGNFAVDDKAAVCQIERVKNRNFAGAKSDDTNFSFGVQLLKSQLVVAAAASVPNSVALQTTSDIPARRESQSPIELSFGNFLRLAKSRRIIFCAAENFSLKSVFVLPCG